MKVAIPTFATRVSPRFDCAQDVLVITIEAGGAPERQELRASDWTPHERINRLLDLEVDTILCGGIDCRSVESFQSAGVTVYSWVTGEIEDALSALLRGDLDFQATKQTGDRCRRRRFLGGIDSQGRDPVPDRASKAAADMAEEAEEDMGVVAQAAHATIEDRRILTAIPNTG